MILFLKLLAIDQQIMSKFSIFIDKENTAILVAEKIS